MWERMNHSSDRSGEPLPEQDPAVPLHISSRASFWGHWCWGLCGRCGRWGLADGRGLCVACGVSHSSDGPTRQIRGHGPSRQNFSCRRMDSGQKGQVGARGGARHKTLQHTQDCRLLGRRPGPHRAAPREWPPCLLGGIGAFQPFSLLLLPAFSQTWGARVCLCRTPVSSLSEAPLDVRACPMLSVQAERGQV